MLRWLLSTDKVIMRVAALTVSPDELDEVVAHLNASGDLLSAAKIEFSRAMIERAKLDSTVSFTAHEKATEA